MLSVEELSELEDRIIEEIQDKWTEILTMANKHNQLEELLTLLRLPELLAPEKETFKSYKNGKIMVIGGTEVKEDVLLAIGKKLGIDKSRFEFCLDYEDIQKYNFRKMQYSPQYRVILFGPAPHSGYGKGDSGSILAELEKTEGYPRVERLISGTELKITKSNYKEKLQQLISEDYI